MPAYTGTVLLVGASRGLGASLARTYAAKNYLVLATARTSNPPANSKNIQYIPSIDLADPSSSSTILHYLSTRRITNLDIVIITASTYSQETLSTPSYDAQLSMYKTCAIGPTLLISSLAAPNPAYQAINPASSLIQPASKSMESLDLGYLGKGSKVILVSSEAGSIALRSETKGHGGGGNYGHHGSKAALNMCARLLSLDLRRKGVSVCAVHPGFMRTETGRRIADHASDKESATKESRSLNPLVDQLMAGVSPDVAAQSLMEWIEGFDMRKSGQFWAPRGASDVTTAPQTMGPLDKLGTSCQLPW